MSAFDTLPETVQFKNINGVIVFSSGVILNEEGKAFKPFLKKDMTQNAKPTLKICIPSENGYKQLSIARMVATLFVPNPDNLPHVRHKDGNYENCDYRNLEWYCSHDRKNVRKLTDAEIKAALKKIDVQKLSVVDLAIYHYLQGEKRPFLEIFLSYGNQAYCMTVVKNELLALRQNAQYSFVHTAKTIVTYFNDVIESLITRGYRMPTENCDDAVFWCYVRKSLQGLVRGYLSDLRLRARINGIQV